MPGRLTRRALLAGGAGGVIGLLTGCEPGAESERTTPRPMPSATPSTPRLLLAYFSRAGENYWNGGRRTLTVGNTERVAAMIQARVALDTYRIEAAQPYSDSYDETVDRNVQEQNANARPTIVGSLPDVSGYDAILLGSPIWNVRPPMILSTFLDGVDTAGKIIHPFVTYAVSGLGTTIETYTDRAPDATITAGFAIRGEDVDASTSQLENWLSEVGALMQ